jgi:hypothetical protein
MVGGEEWQEKVFNREEWNKHLRTARNRHILQIPMKCMTERMTLSFMNYRLPYCPIASCGYGRHHTPE